MLPVLPRERDLRVVGATGGGGGATGVDDPNNLQNDLPNLPGMDLPRLITLGCSCSGRMEADRPLVDGLGCGRCIGGVSRLLLRPRRMRRVGREEWRAEEDGMSCDLLRFLERRGLRPEKRSGWEGRRRSIVLVLLLLLLLLLPVDCSEPIDGSLPLALCCLLL